jgi:hypothetical protein
MAFAFATNHPRGAVIFAGRKAANKERDLFKFWTVMKGDALHASAVK